MKLNNNNTLLGIIDNVNSFHLVDLRRLVQITTISNKVKLTSSWNFIFAKDIYNTVIINDKSNIQILHKIDLSEEEIVIEKPQISCNHVVEYSDMSLFTVCLDRICLMNPSEASPEKKYLRWIFSWV